MDGHNNSKDFRFKDLNQQFANLYRPTEQEPILVQSASFIGREKRPKTEDLNVATQDMDEDGQVLKGNCDIYQ